MEDRGSYYYRMPQRDVSKVGDVESHPLLAKGTHPRNLDHHEITRLVIRLPFCIERHGSQTM